MAERYFFADKFMVDLDTVTLCDKPASVWRMRQQGNPYDRWIDDDATGVALFSALCAWRKERKMVRGVTHGD